MDAAGGKEAPLLPPGYVSLAQLRDRWMRMQEGKNLKGHNEDEKKGTSSETPNDSETPHHGPSKIAGEVGGDGKTGGDSGFRLPQEPPRRKALNNCRRKSEVQGNGIAVSGPESRDEYALKMDKQKFQETETVSVGATNVDGEQIPKGKGRANHGGFGRNSEKKSGEEVLPPETRRNGASSKSHGNRNSGKKSQSTSTSGGDQEAAAGNARSKLENVGCSTARNGNRGIVKVWVKKGEKPAGQ